MKVGFIGLGAMGNHMAKNLAATHQLSGVWNRDLKKAHAFAKEMKVKAFKDPMELAQETDFILMCISADQDVLNVVDSILPGLTSASIVIDLSTVNRDTAVDVAAKIRNKGADFLDAPVTGGVEGAKNGTLSIMVGGELETLNRVKPLLHAIGKRILHMGTTGQGQSAKAVNQVMCAGINEAVTEALAFGEKLGLDMPNLIEAISGGAAGNWFLDKRGLTMTHDQFTPGFKVSLHHKDLVICEKMAEDLKIEIPLTKMTRHHYETLMKLDFGDEDISSLYRLKRLLGPHKA